VANIESDSMRLIVEDGGLAINRWLTPARFGFLIPGMSLLDNRYALS
jgi:hypothetical protein